jgi:mannose-6-phosphate isomerase-like protein (cupin superfamily)
MLTLIALFWGLLTAAQAPSAGSASVVTAAQLDATLKQAIASNTVDTMVKTTPIMGGNATVAVLHRVRAETSALIHDHVTEVYQITAGSGTLTTGGSLQNPTESDLTRLGAGMSHSGTHVGGTAQHVGPRDVVIITAGMPHRFSQLDGPISYLVYRFDPTPAKP